LVVWAAVLVGLAGSVVAVQGRGGEDLFRLAQSRALLLTHPRALDASGVQGVVEQAPEPVAPAKRTPPVEAHCRPGGAGPLRNPWSCTIRYRSGTRAHYRVQVQPNGYYSGTGTGIIEGCCVKVPTLN
jgi:hypothetical protein